MNILTIPADCLLFILRNLTVAEYIRLLRTGSLLSSILRDQLVQRATFKIPCNQQTRIFLQHKYFFDFAFVNSRHFQGGYYPKIFAGKVSMRHWFSYDCIPYFNNFTIYCKEQTAFPDKNQILFNFGFARDPIAKDSKLKDIQKRHLIGGSPYQKNIGIIINYHQDRDSGAHFYQVEIWYMNSKKQSKLIPVDSPKQIVINVFCCVKHINFTVLGEEFVVENINMQWDSWYPCYKLFRDFSIEKFSF